MCMDRLIIVKMFVLLKLIYRFNIIPIKIPLSYFVDRNRWILKFIHSLAKGPEQGRQHCRRRTKKTNTMQLQDLLQSYSNQYTVAVAKE